MGGAGSAALDSLRTLVTRMAYSWVCAVYVFYVIFALFDVGIG